MTVYWTSLLVAFAVVAAGVTTADRAASRREDLTPAQAYELVCAHNAWRQRVGALSLRWASDLADRAQARAEDLARNGCVIAHGPLPRDLGENLFYASALRHSGGRADELVVVTPTEVVDDWGAEYVDYSPAHDTCAWNRQCGHYTQIVWATTTEVGCGMSVCPTLGQVWVCNYRPRGNVRMVR